MRGSGFRPCFRGRESGELHLYRGSRRRIDESKLGAVELRHGLHEAETQAVARRRAAPLQAVEPLEHVLALGGGYSCPVVAHLEPDSRKAVGLDAHLDVALAVL